MKLLLASLLCLFALSAFAQPCDVTLVATVTGPQAVTITTRYAGLDPATAKTHAASRAQVANYSTSQADKGGAYTLTLHQEGCGTNVPDKVDGGMTAIGVRNVLRKATAHELALTFPNEAKDGNAKK